MKFFDKIFDFLNDLSEKNFIHFIVIFLAFVAGLCGVIIYKYYSSSSDQIKQIRTINNLRTEAKDLLERNLAIKKQQEKVDEILNKDKNFKIINYFDTLTKELRLNNYINEKSKQINISDVESKQNYSEIRLSVKIQNINMKQLTGLLEKIENNERVFIKKLDINKSEKLPAIDADLTIATLEEKT